MFDTLAELFTAYPYAAVGLVIILCGIGLPLPEELVLIAAGYTCYQQVADVIPMIVTCVVAILGGDFIPFYLGHAFGARLLRIRWMRIVVHKRRLATFDGWFRRRGDLVIFLARFIAGLRVVAYFTAGTMKMSWKRFLLLDLAGVVITAPVLVFVGSAFGGLIHEAVAKVQKVERAVLVAVAGGAVLVALWLWLRHRRQRRRVMEGPSETFVGPTIAPELEINAGDLLPSLRDEPRPGAGAPPRETGTGVPDAPPAEPSPAAGPSDEPRDPPPRG